MQKTVQTFSAEQTRILGQKIGETMPPNTVIAAFGGLGLGKTVFAQGLARGLGISGPVTSPTYIYIQEYQGRLPFCHIDAYRMEQLEEEEIAQLGLSECFLSGKTAYVEWPQFISLFLPQKNVIELHFSALPQQPEVRCLEFCYEEKVHSWITALVSRFKGSK
ncbi:MAG: tRNA (adenosine(37)-N6)-threonylcarbamoyltransferase complex ATPase subunit type 1 TsaE [Firmicutes bacterium]|nr:tRNA (adenosine(37)-N6)-threonylcarbamoyltransferase complex ATPase subunit type 1 TsaE [Bacillota bacterium]